MRPLGYTAYFRTALSAMAAYRLDFLVGRVRTVIVFLALSWLWLAVFQGKMAKGFDEATIFAYILVASLLSDVVFHDAHGRITEDIVSGQVSASLVKPQSYFWMIFMDGLAPRTLALATVPVQLLLFRLVFPGRAIEVTTSPGAWVAFSASVLCAVALFSIVDFLSGSAAFWLDRSHGPRWFLEILSRFGSGAFIPLALLPDALRGALWLTPFPSLIAVPARIATGGPTPWTMVGIQAAWVIALGLLARAVWRGGIRRYEAVGI